jgi:glyoxylase-like metal-dependent hydrolase (beta-lactamase superfamily II)
VGEPSVDALYEQVRTLVSARETDDAPPELIPVAPRIRVLALRTPTLPPATRTNTYLVGPDSGVQWVVDPGSPYADQQGVLDHTIASEAAAGRPLGGILLTHHHGDHVGGASALAARWNVPIAAHAATAKRLAGRVAITRELLDDEVVEAGGDVTLRCVFTPGHADGHLCFEVGGAVIAGDMVAGIGWILIDPAEGDMALYLASLERLLERPAMLLPAHGPAISDGAAKLREYIEHRLMREARVVAALARRGDAGLADLVSEVYSDTPRAMWPLAQRSLRAHLDKLAKEGKAVEVGSGRWSRG